MAVDRSQAPAEWESEHVAEPMNFPAIVFATLATVMQMPLGRRARLGKLRDLEALLKPYQDDTYRDAVKLAMKEGSEDNRQLAFLQAIMGLLKRSGFLGETWKRG